MYTSYTVMLLVTNEKRIILEHSRISSDIFHLSFHSTRVTHLWTIDSRLEAFPVYICVVYTTVSTVPADVFRRNSGK